MAGIQGVIFDFNGTMIFDSPIHRAVWHDFIPEHTGQTITDEQVDRTMLGRDNAHILRQYFGNISDFSDIKGNILVLIMQHLQIHILNL